jgi:hypothetical protein
MIPRSYLTVSLALIITFVFCYFYFTSTKVTNKRNVTNVTMVDIATSTRYSLARGMYPQFANASDDFNGSIADLVNQGIQDHAKSSQDNWRARFETALPGDTISEFPKENERFEYYIASTTIVRNDDKVISVVLRIYEFSGAAHGLESILTFNYDLVSKKEITIDDYLDKDISFLKKLSAFSRTKLVEKMLTVKDVKAEEINRTMLNDGTTPVKGNFSLFTIPSDTELTFYFTQYQVAPYVFGSFDLNVEIPLK